MPIGVFNPPRMPIGVLACVVLGSFLLFAIHQTLQLPHSHLLNQSNMARSLAQMREAKRRRQEKEEQDVEEEGQEETQEYEEAEEEEEEQEELIEFTPEEREVIYSYGYHKGGKRKRSFQPAPTIWEDEPAEDHPLSR